jgi:hypothetical protein
MGTINDKKGLVRNRTNPLFIPYYFKCRTDYIRNGTISSATTFKILIIGLIAGPAVSL